MWCKIKVVFFIEMHVLVVIVLGCTFLDTGVSIVIVVLTILRKQFSALLSLLLFCFYLLRMRWMLPRLLFGIVVFGQHITAASAWFPYTAFHTLLRR